jgi:glutamate formiminotransferase
MIPERRRLEKVRRDGFDGRPPDIGDIASHPRAGASVVGARGFLIAFNVNLDTEDVQAARAVAKSIRESSGGFPFVKAMGRYLASRKCAQVSMNLTNFDQTPLDQVFDAIRAQAPVRSCQLVGLVPRRAFEMFPEFFKRAENFEPARVLENRIEELSR